MTTRELEALHFGAVPVSVDPRAAELLSQLPPRTLEAVILSVRGWAEKASVRRARVLYDLDPEATFWEQAIVELDIDAETDRAFELEEEVAAIIDSARAGLAPSEQSWLDSHFDVHLNW